MVWLCSLLWEFIKNDIIGCRKALGRGGGGQGCRGKASRFVYNSYSTYLVLNFIDILQWEALTSREILRFIQFHVKTNTQS